MCRTLGAVCLLVLWGLVAGLVVLTGPAAPPGSAQYGSPDLAINLYIAPGETDPFAPGSVITYEIYVINQGSGMDASDVMVRSSLPEHTTYVSSSGPGFSLIQPGPDEVAWFKQQLQAWEIGWLSVTVRVDDDAPVGAPGDHRAQIYSMADQDSDSDNNESSVLRYVLPAEPDLRITKHLWPDSDPIAAGNEIAFEITAENQGGSAASSVRITDTLPAGCTYTSDDPAGSGFATAQTGQTVVWTMDTMAPDVYGPTPEPLLVRCQVAGDWTPDQWLENVVEISTPDAEYSTDNNLSRWTYKPEADRRYATAVSWMDDRTMRLASDGGFDYVLYYLDWFRIEPEDGDYDWGRLDEAVWQAWHHNLRLMVRVYRAPDWARGPGDATAPPSNPAQLGEFLEAVAARWPRQTGDPDQPQIYGYVIWNEPNLAAEWGGNTPDAAAYAVLLQAAYGGVKAGSPDAWVISAGLAPTGDDPPQAVDDRSYLQQIYDVPGAGSYFDYLGANPMGFAYAPDDASDPNGLNFERAEAWREIMVANGDGAKDMFGAETGWLRDTARDLGARYNWMKVSEIDQAHYLARAYHKARCDWQRRDGTPWMGPLTTWNLDFAGGDYTPNDHAYWFSLTDENREPLRAYLTLQNAATRGPADLWLEKELLDPLKPGQDFRYLIRYTNIGGQTAAGVLMTDTLPAGTEYVADSGGGTMAPSGDQIVWNLGDVDTCTYQAITLTLRLDGGDLDPAGLTNRVEANAMPGEPYTDDNVATVTTSFPDLGIHKTVTPGVAAPGQTLTYTLSFSNSGQETATGVFITDVVPLTLTNVSYAHSGAAVTATGSTPYVWQVQDLGADEGGAITITGVVHPDLRGTSRLTNRASITTTSADLFTQNNVSVASSAIDAEPPLPPTLLAPADGAITSDTIPSLTWSASPSPDVAGYLVNFNGVVLDVGSVTQYNTQLLAEGAYTWTVAAYDAVGHTSAYASIWSFTVDTTAPGLPALVKPLDGAHTTDRTPALIWQASTSPDVAGYLLDFDGTIVDVGNVTGRTMNRLAHESFDWRVAAYDAAGNTSAYTSAWSFTVDRATTLAPPTLISPVDGAHTTSRTPKLIWQASPSPGVAGYLLDLDSTVVDVGDVTQYTTGLLDYRSYDWRVAAYDDSGKTSAYASAWSFAVDTPTALAPPTLISPMNGARTTDRTPVLIWQASPSPASPSQGVAGYLLDLDGIVVDVGDATQHTPGLLTHGSYEWTVAAYDAAGHAGAYASPWSFTIEPYGLYLPLVTRGYQPSAGTW